jgi:hypothetical protein
MTNAAIATRPTRLTPQMKAADHHLRWIDQAVMQPRNLTRPESTCPMGVFQLASQTRLAAGDPGEGEEAILKVTRQKGTVLQIFDRLSLGVQQSLYALDDRISTGQEELKKLDMCLKRHLAETWSGWPLVRRKERMKSHEDAWDRGGIVIRALSNGEAGLDTGIPVNSFTRNAALRLTASRVAVRAEQPTGHQLSS